MRRQQLSILSSDDSLTMFSTHLLVFAVLSSVLWLVYHYHRERVEIKFLVRRSVNAFRFMKSQYISTKQKTLKRIYQRFPVNAINQTNNKVSFSI